MYAFPKLPRALTTLALHYHTAYIPSTLCRSMYSSTLGRHTSRMPLHLPGCLMSAVLIVISISWFSLFFCQRTGSRQATRPRSSSTYIRLLPVFDAWSVTEAQFTEYSLLPVLLSITARVRTLVMT